MEKVSNPLGKTNCVSLLSDDTSLKLFVQPKPVRKL